jgi:hypothetical protein
MVTKTFCAGPESVSEKLVVTAFIKDALINNLNKSQRVILSVRRISLELTEILRCAQNDSCSSYSRARPKLVVTAFMRFQQREEQPGDPGAPDESGHYEQFSNARLLFPRRGASLSAWPGRGRGDLEFVLDVEYPRLEAGDVSGKASVVVGGDHAAEDGGLIVDDYVQRRPEMVAERLTQHLGQERLAPLARSKQVTFPLKARIPERGGRSDGHSLRRRCGGLPSLAEGLPGLCDLPWLRRLRCLLNLSLALRGGLAGRARGRARLARRRLRFGARLTRGRPGPAGPRLLGPEERPGPPGGDPAQTRCTIDCGGWADWGNPARCWSKGRARNPARGWAWARTALRRRNPAALGKRGTQVSGVRKGSGRASATSWAAAAASGGPGLPRPSQEPKGRTPPPTSSVARSA